MDQDVTIYVINGRADECGIPAGSSVYTVYSKRTLSLCGRENKLFTLRITSPWVMYDTHAQSFHYEKQVEPNAVLDIVLQPMSKIGNKQVEGTQAPSTSERQDFDQPQLLEGFRGGIQK